MRRLETDVLIIGSGLAGLRAAIESARYGARTTVISKSGVGVGCNSVLVGGGFSMAVSDFTVGKHIETTLETGKRLNDPDLVQEMAVNGPREAEFLKSIGVKLSRMPTGYELTTKGSPGEMRIPKGVVLMRRVRDEALKYPQIDLIPYLFVYKILVEEGGVSGVIGIDKDGPCLILSKAVILAAGGGGGIYRRTDNSRAISGDGYALALEAGLSLYDMEFVQFYPLGFAEPGLPPSIVYPPFPPEARILDGEGKDFLVKHGTGKDLRDFVISHRDKATYLIYTESQKGKVFLDYTGVAEKRWSEFPLSFFPMKRFNFREKPFQISPLTHFFMGGVKMQPSGQTDLGGLFAAGEVTAGVHGANRLGGNALTECLVFGAKCGHSAAVHAKGSKLREASPAATQWLEAVMGDRPLSDIHHNLARLKNRIRDIAWTHAGPIRNETQIRKGLSFLSDARNELQSLKAGHWSDLISRKKVENSLLVLQSILMSSLARQESIGAFQRDDFPQKALSNTMTKVSLRVMEEGAGLIIELARRSLKQEVV